MPRPLSLLSALLLALVAVARSTAVASPPDEQESAPTPPPTAAAPPQIRVFTEHPLDRPIDPVSAAVLTPMALWTGGPNQYQKLSVDSLAAYLASLPPGYRAADLNWVAACALKWGKDSFGIVPDPIRTAEAGKLDLSFDTRRLRQFAAALERRGVTLDLIYTDVEDGINYWHLTPEQRASLLRSTAADRNLPERLAALDAEPAWNTPEWRQMVIDWGGWAEELRATAIEGMLRDSGLLKPTTTAVNFWTFVPSFTLYDFNGWPQHINATIDGRTNCPVLFLSPGTFRYPWPELKKDRAWNALIEDLNKVRSCVATGPVVPVLREAGAGAAGRWTNDQLIGHVLRSGVTTMIFFNCDPTADAAAERDFAHAVLRHQRSARAWAPDQPSLPEIPLDADEIRTGDLTTRYADFVREQQPAATSSSPPVAAPR